MNVESKRSSGVLLYRIGPIGDRQYLLLDHGSHWDFPKGGIEIGESDRDAALRELFEETGIRSCRFDESYQREISYILRSDTRLVRKTVVFFLANTDESEVRLSDEHVGFCFLPPVDALLRLTYPASRELLRLAEQHLIAVSENTGP